jgi:hypothetical protein
LINVRILNGWILDFDLDEEMAIFKVTGNLFVWEQIGKDIGLSE